MTLTLLISMGAALVIVLHGIFSVINGMTRCTAFVFRVAWISVTTGALYYLLVPFFNLRPPSTWEAFLLSGMAMFILFDRRCRQRRKGDVAR